jgi:hypothetical protein
MAASPMTPTGRAESRRGILRKGEMQSENQSPVAAFLFFVERLP